ncbi:MAG: hypothetical protein AB3N16_04900 [Flavobacteriaceae bacterium]
MTIDAPKPKKDKQSLLLRIERTGHDIDQIEKQLCSYRYEPRTLESYKKFEVLKSRLEHMHEDNRTLWGNLQRNMDVKEAEYRKVRSHLLDFNDLQFGVSVYMQEVRGL